jgi:hypothetical protein
MHRVLACPRFRFLHAENLGDGRERLGGRRHLARLQDAHPWVGQEPIDAHGDPFESERSDLWFGAGDPSGEKLSLSGAYAAKVIQTPAALERLDHQHAAIVQFETGGAADRR